MATKKTAKTKKAKPEKKKTTSKKTTTKKACEPTRKQKKACEPTRKQKKAQKNFKTMSNRAKEIQKKGGVKTVKVFKVTRAEAMKKAAEEMKK